MAWSAAELCDLRELVARLPERQRAVVIMRYWQDAQERDIAASLASLPTDRPAMLCVPTPNCAPPTSDTRVPESQ